MKIDYSKNMELYFDKMELEVKQAYSLCAQAKKKGYDPEDENSIPLAKNMAERVEGIISVLVPQIGNSGLAPRIHELEEKYGKLSWKVAFVVSLETAKQKFCKFGSRKIKINDPCP